MFDGLQRRCRDCQKTVMAAYFQRSKGRTKIVRAIRRHVYYETHREEEKAQATAWTAANRDQFNAAARTRYEADPEPFKGRSAAYRKANPHVINEQSARRRARKRAAFVTPVSVAEIYERDKGRCGICGDFVGLDNISLDHVIPLARGGTHEPCNIQLSHLRCNLKKGAH